MPRALYPWRPGIRRIGQGLRVLVMSLNRREFLKALAGLGAAVVLPTKATTAEVNAEWSRMLREPWYFDVEEYGTIVESGHTEPKIRADVFDDIDLGGMKTVDDLIDQVEYCTPLVSLFQSLASDELDELRDRLDEDDDARREIDDVEDPDEQHRLRQDLMPSAERARLEHLAQMLGDDNDGWKDWCRSCGPDGLPRLTKIIEDWLADPVDWGEQEWFPRGWSGQGKALAFFQSTAAEVADELGVVIVEGEHPGSTYFAAELRVDVDDANEVATRLRLPFRFRRV